MPDQHAATVESSDPRRPRGGGGTQTSHGWHAALPDEALRRLASQADGLTTSEARRRLVLHGANSLLVAPPRPNWRIFWDQLRSPIVALLAAAALLAQLLLDDSLDAVAILAVLAINVAIGFLSERQARRTMESLRSMEVGQARVVRDAGRVHAIDARTLVPGDIVDLEPGLAVPADLRLVESAELRANEAPLTGESFPVPKGLDPVPAESVLAERSSMLFKGTLVIAGTGRGVVVATGMDTEIGQISDLVQRTPDDATPLERRLDRLGRRLAGLAVALAALVALLGWLRGGAPWLMLETGIALAVAAVPEGLPVVATITLAVGMARMARRNALIRRLPAVEALGSVTVVCTDKTGTLTAGQMTATRILLDDDAIEITGAGYGPDGQLQRDGSPLTAEPGSTLHDALRVAALANGARVVRGEADWTAQGDPTEAALLVAAAKGGVGRESQLAALPEVGEVPFSSERMLMATFHRDGPRGDVLACVKGAPERLLPRCTTRRPSSGDGLPLDAADRQRLAACNDELAASGLRVLALAQGRVADRGEGGVYDERDLADLEHLALVGFVDPPAAGVEATIRALRRAGIRTVMITGDQPRTAEAVARSLGVLQADEAVVDGSRLASLDDGALVALLEHAGAFSRTAPADKLRIVQGLQARGEVVGMLGDGVNDAAALKGADVGVAMGRRGTDVAKDTADIVLADDSLATVAAAVEGGRVINDNIRKFIFYLFSCNLSEVLVLLVAAVAGLPLPLLPLQILWLNLVTDVFPALALAMEPAEPDVMARPPAAPSASILSRRFTSAIALYALLLTLPVLAVFLWGLSHGDERHARTLAFLALALGQILHALNARGQRAIVLARRVWSNPWMWGAIALCTALMLAAVFVTPLSSLLRLAPVSALDSLVVLAAGLVPLIAGQLIKARR